MTANDILALMREHLDVVLAISSALVALVSAVASRAETRRQRRLQTEHLRQTIDSASLEWGTTAIEALGRAAMFARTRHLQANDGTFVGGKTSLLISLSALVERGRMFFPNVDAEMKGAEKEGAYRGHRPPILDAIMWAYFELNAMTRDTGPTGDSSADFIDDCRRLMVSELQAHLDPRRLDKIIERYDDQSARNRREAIDRAQVLKAQLQTRRPGLVLDPAPASRPSTEKAS
ncbi:hypothetical protein [Hyphomonas johnsonii]|nr:hypothetical protein [Hyphomonas johnsonii]